MIRNNFNDIVFVNSKRVGCSGSDDSSAHPLIYLKLEKQGSVVCPYCNRAFNIQKESSTKVNFDKNFNKSNH